MKYTVVDTSKMIARKNGEVVPVIGGRDYSEETAETDPRSFTLTVKGWEKEAERVIRDRENRLRLRLCPAVMPITLYERLQPMPPMMQTYFADLVQVNGVRDNRIVWKGTKTDLAFIGRYLERVLGVSRGDVESWFTYEHEELKRGTFKFLLTDLPKDLYDDHRAFTSSKALSAGTVARVRDWDQELSKKISGSVGVVSSP